MITLKIIPQAAASATEQNLLVEFDETLCKPYNTTNSNGAIASVSFQAGAVTVLNGNAIVPIIATIVLNTPNGCGNGCCNTNVFVEQTSIAFIATTTNNITITPGQSVLTVPTNVKCNKIHGVKINTTIEVSIA